MHTMIALLSMLTNTRRDLINWSPQCSRAPQMHSSKPSMLPSQDIGLRLHKELQHIALTPLQADAAAQLRAICASAGVAPACALVLLPAASSPPSATAAAAEGLGMQVAVVGPVSQVRASQPSSATGPSHHKHCCVSQTPALLPCCSVVQRTLPAHH
jgi:hypothetical protein